MRQSQVMPSEAELKNRPFKVVVFKINDQDVEMAKASGVGSSVAGAIIKHVSQSNAEIVDRKGLDELKQAIEKNLSGYKNSSRADYAITGHIAVANYSKEFHKATSYKDKEGKIHYTEPYCAHNALVQGNLHIHALRDMQHAYTINISGGASRNTKLLSGYRYRCNDLTRPEILSLVRSAGSKAANREDVTLQNFFQPRGYVLERRTNGKQYIFKITLGQRNGALKGQKAEFFNLSKSTHPITKKTVTHETKIGEGAVTNKVFDKFAWVITDNEAVASQIKLGDVVKLSFEKSLFGKIFNRSYNN